MLDADFNKLISNAHKLEDADHNLAIILKRSLAGMDLSNLDICNLTKSVYKVILEFVYIYYIN